MMGTLVKYTDLPSIAREWGIVLSDTAEQMLTRQGESFGRMANRELLPAAQELAVGAVRDLGLQATDAYDAARIGELLRGRFPELTTTDIRLAFDMYLVGDLDSEFRDLFGSVPQAFGKLSAMFVARVLRAYAQKRSKVRVELVKKIYEREAMRPPTKKDRYDMLTVLRDILHAIAEGKEPTFILTKSVQELLERCGILPGVIEPNESDRNTACKVVEKERGPRAAAAALRSIAADAMTEDFRAITQTKAVRRILVARCVELGKDGLDDCLRTEIERIKAEPTDA